MSRRTVALIASVVLAAVATVALISYIQGERDKARGEGEAVQAYVAKEVIAAGTGAEQAISQGLIEPKTITKTALADDAIGSLSEIAGKVAATTIYPNEQIIGQRFVAPAQARGTSLQIPEGRQAMSLEVGVVPGVANFVQPGDNVSILAQISVPRGNEQEIRVQFLLQRIEVLQVGRRAFTEAGEETITRPNDNVILTVAVNARQAEKLAFAILQGELYLTLLPEGQGPSSTPGRTAANAFAG